MKSLMMKAKMLFTAGASLIGASRLRGRRGLPFCSVAQTILSVSRPPCRGSRFDRLKALSLSMGVPMPLRSFRILQLSKILPLAAIMALAVSATLVAGEAEEKTQFQKYKEAVKQDPALIRFYTFEEGQGDEVANHVKLGGSQTAVTGGPLGSLTMHRYNVYGRCPIVCPSISSPETVSPEWTRGRWPWKAAVASGSDKIQNAWEATCLFRSGITGAEFADGGTFAGWLRIPEDMAAGRSNILSVGGSNLMYNGGLRFTASSTDKVANGATVTTKFSPGVWHHFSVTFDKASLKLYLDGELRDEKPFAGAIIPVIWSEMTLSGPFHEFYCGFGEFMKVGRTVPNAGETISRFDIDELSIYKRALTAAEVKRQEEAGRPAMSQDQQLADGRALKVAQEQLARIKLDIPKDTGGYFRIKQAIPATVSVPAEFGACKALFTLETLDGKPLQKLERNLEAGKSVTENILPPECGVFYLDMELRGSEGKPLKSQRYCLGIVPPAPKELTVNNPMACWADGSELFHFDAPIRRLFIYDVSTLQIDAFQKQYAHYDKLIPNFRGYVMFGVNKSTYPEMLRVLKGKKIFGLEFTSEPHAPCDTKAYVAGLKAADELFRPAFPGILFFPPGIEGTSLSVLDGILENGGMQYMDGVSYHPYRMTPLRDYCSPDNLTQRLKKLLAKYPGKKLTLWNTESGFQALPRRSDSRPMTDKDAIAAGFGGDYYSGVYYGSSMMPEWDAAALQCHDILLNLAEGYKMYTVLSGPVDEGGMPGLRGVAVTALAGQVLNNLVEVSPLPLASAESFCALIKNTDGTTTAAVFGMEPTTENFKVPPNAEYRTMDMLGNYGSIRADADGLLAVQCTRAPIYVFNVPAGMQAVAPLRLVLPSVLPEDHLLKGELTVSNQLATALAGKLSVAAIPGATITLSKTGINLAPGQSEKIAVELRANALKRRSYTLTAELRTAAGKLISSTQASFQSPGVIQMIPQLKTAFQLDGDEAKWKDIPAMACDDADSVVHGKPNIAEPWIPQWHGKDDLSFTVKTAWRKGDGVYFLLKAKDNVLCPAPDDKVSTAWQYDCLEFFFDSRERSKQGALLSDGMDQVIVIPQAGETASSCKLWYGCDGRNQVDVQCVGRKTKDGYLIEGKVAPNAKSAFQVQAGSQFRMDFLLDDADSLETKLLRKAAMALHGDFGNNRNSDAWGRYELEPTSKGK